MKKIKFKSNEKTEKSKSKGVPFVATHHPSLNCLYKIIRGNTYLLYMNEEVKNSFLPRPMVSFRGVRKFSTYLVKAKSYPLHRKLVSKKYAKNQLNCDDRCIIYLLTCKQCQKQYTRETKDDFRYRWNNYKSKSRKFDRKESCIQEHLYKHFSSLGHRIP